MEVVIDQKGEETVIKIKGRLDTNTARECEEKVLPVWENPGVKVCVDCSDLEYVIKKRGFQSIRLFTCD